MKNNSKAKRKLDDWAQLLLVLALLMPLIIFFLLPGGGMFAGGLWFWFALLLCFSLIWMMLGSPAAAEAADEEESHRALSPEEQPATIAEVMNVRMAEEERGVRVFRGRLRKSAAATHEQLKSAFGRETVPMVQEDERLGAAILLVPKPVEEATLERSVHPWVNWLLFGLTILTTTWAGAAHQGINLLREPERFAAGLPYSLALLAILGVHEMGHYFTARYHKMNVTPPYFIPVPFALGTFGAFIKMRSPSENRRALFDVAVAGPLAGLVIAIPALLIGLRTSTILPPGTVPGMMQGTSAGSSVLFALLAKLSLGDALQYGYILRLSPLAFAGWLGLFVTALNLLPIGQLDGGHIARSMFGTRMGATISSVAIWTLLLLGVFVWPGLLTWAIIVFFIAGRGTTPLNDVTPVTSGRKWIGAFAFLILALILAPLPHALWGSAGIYCPYM